MAGRAANTPLAFFGSLLSFRSAPERRSGAGASLKHGPAVRARRARVLHWIAAPSERRATGPLQRQRVSFAQAYDCRPI